MSPSRSLPDTLQLSVYLFLSILQADQDISSSLSTHSSAQKPSMAPYDLRTRCELLNLNCKTMPHHGATPQAPPLPFSPESQAAAQDLAAPSLQGTLRLRLLVDILLGLSAAS